MRIYINFLCLDPQTIHLELHLIRFFEHLPTILNRFDSKKLRFTLLKVSFNAFQQGVSTISVALGALQRDLTTQPKTDRNQVGQRFGAVFHENSMY
jgi:hypothetical protein